MLSQVNFKIVFGADHNFFNETFFCQKVLTQQDLMFYGMHTFLGKLNFL